MIRALSTKRLEYDRKRVTKMMKKSFVIVAAIVLCILIGCRSMERITESEAIAIEATSEVTPDAMQDVSMSEPTENENNANPAEEAIGTAEADVSNASAPISLTVEGPVGVCEYTVDSFALYDSWANAGISEDQLSSSNYPVGDAGIILVTITQYCESRNEISLEDETMYVGCFQPIAQSQLDGAKASNDYQKYLYIETDLGLPPSYLDQPGKEEKRYFYYPALNAGESATYTLGFVLSDTTRAAAEDGTLLLWYTTNGMPETVDELLLLPVK